jgi:hypothetical protein
MITLALCVSRGLLVLLAVGVIATYVGPSILTPLWLDAMSWHGHAVTVNKSLINASVFPAFNLTPAHLVYQHVDGFFIPLFAHAIYTLVFGIILGVMMLAVPGQITDRERKYNKGWFMLIGGSDAICAVLFVYAASGSRTAPYLQALSSNFNIPVTFIMRYVFLYEVHVGKCTLFLRKYAY